MQDTFFDSGRKCVAMVTAYYTVKKYCGAGVLITFSDISSSNCSCSILILVQVPSARRTWMNATLPSTPASTGEPVKTRSATSPASACRDGTAGSATSTKMTVRRSPV